MWRTVPYNILGVVLWSVEKDGYIAKYCDDKEDAVQQCEDLNNGKQ